MLSTSTAKKYTIINTSDHVYAIWSWFSSVLIISPLKRKTLFPKVLYKRYQQKAWRTEISVSSESEVLIINTFFLNTGKNHSKNRTPISKSSEKSFAHTISPNNSPGFRSLEKNMREEEKSFYLVSLLQNRNSIERKIFLSCSLSLSQRV
jgi:hypothetical protein